jgi:predicted FMN-binding regulatory protein PaiB
MAQRVEVTVADIVRSFAKGVIGERIAVRKLEAIVKASQRYEGLLRDEIVALEKRVLQAESKPVIHTDNL